MAQNSTRIPGSVNVGRQKDHRAGRDCQANRPLFAQENAGKPEAVVPVPARNYRDLFRAFQVVKTLGQGDVPVPLENALKNMAVIDALFRSARSGSWEAPLA